MAAKRGTYSKPLRTQAMTEIRRRRTDGYSHEQIMKDLRLSERSYYRYLRQAYENDVKALEQANVQDLELVLLNLHDRWSAMYRDALAQARDGQQDPMSRVKSREQAVDLAWKINALERKLPEAIALQYRLDEQRQLPELQAQQQPQDISSYKEEHIASNPTNEQNNVSKDSSDSVADGVPPQEQPAPAPPTTTSYPFPEPEPEQPEVFRRTSTRTEENSRSLLLRRRQLDQHLSTNRDSGGGLRV